MSITYKPEFRPEFEPQKLLQKVQTIGYRQANGLAEIERIMAADPELLLVDIRFSPRSQNLQWTKTAFSKKYKKQYLWIKQLGNVNHNKNDTPIEIADAQAGIEQLLELLQDHNILLLCGCEEYETCHRKVVYELLEAHMHVHMENIPRNNLTRQVLEDAIESKEVEATCFSEDLTEESPKPKNRKANLQELQARISELEARNNLLELYKPEMINSAHQSVKQAHLTLRDLKYFLDNIERAYTRLYARLAKVDSNHPDLEELASLYQKCRRKLYDYSEKADQEERIESACFTRTEEEYQIAARIVMEQEQLIHTLTVENTQQRERQAKQIHIIQRQHQREQQTRTQVQTRYHCSIETLLNSPTTTVPLASFNQEQERRKQTEQQLEIINKLESNPKIKPGQEKFIRHVINASKYGKYRDAEGRTRVNLKGIAERMGMSPSTAQRGIQFCEKQLPQLFDITSYTEPSPNGIDDTTRYYAKVKPEAIPHLDTIEPLDFRKQGGDKTICALCGGKHVRVKVERKRILICDDCNRENPPTIDITVSYEYPNADYQKEDAAAYIASQPKGVQNEAIIITSDPPSSCVENNIASAAKLLLAIAGTHDQHIEMSRTGEKKYYSVDRPLSLADLEDHLKGGKARGSLCSHSEGKTRALCFDADDISGWTILQDAAKLLAGAGYVPLLEESPADRGGHLWLISDNMMDGAPAREQVYQIAPDLKEIPEYWPAPASAKKWNRVRLPGAYYCRTGKYVEHDIKGWCKIVNVASGESSHDGASAAALLLGSLTPVEIMVPKNQPPDDYTHKEVLTIEDIEDRANRDLPVSTLDQRVIKALYPDLSKNVDWEKFPQQKPETCTPTIEQPSAIEYKLPVVDEKWEAKNGKITETKLYFAIMPEYAARWFNEHHTLEEIQPRERNGMALSPNGAERTASTTYRATGDGERYTDHSTHGRRPDGTRDTGDALELAAKVRGISKSSLLYETTKQISAQARADLESAANAGKILPAWLEEITTPAGRKRYAWLFKQVAKRIDTQIEQFTEQFVQQENVKPILVELGKAIEAEQTRTEQPKTFTQDESNAPACIVVEQKPDKKPVLVEGMKVETPAGIATVSRIAFVETLKVPRWRCAVCTDQEQPDRSHFAVFDAIEVKPINQSSMF